MKSNITSSTDHCCHICNKYFTLKRNVTKHLKVVHNKIQKLDAKSGLRCPLDCQPRFITRKYALLRDHIYSHHGVTIECEEKTFQSLGEFSLWKRCIENESVCSYITQTAPKRLSFGQRRTYYCCHRSGPARRATSGKRPVKLQGSCKVGTHCPSTLELTEDEGRFHVKYYKTHAGHNLELLHLTLTRDEREDLAGKIMNGESFSKILDDVHGELSDGDAVTRRHLLSRRDLHNIKSELGRRETAAADRNNESAAFLSSEEVKRKLNLMLELIENVAMDEGSYSVLERVLDSTIEFVMEKFTEGNNESVVEAVMETVNVSCLPMQDDGNVPWNAITQVPEVTTRDLHLDLVRCTRDEDCPTAVKDLHLDVIRLAGGRSKPPRRLLPKPDSRTSELHLNVIRCSGEEPSPSLTKTSFKDSHLNVIRCSGDQPSPSFPKTSFKDSHLNVIRSSGDQPSPSLSKTSFKDSHLNVIRCSGDQPSPSLPKTSFKDSHLNVIRSSGDQPSPSLPKTSFKNSHLNVIRCSGDQPSPSLPKTSFKDSHLNVIQSSGDQPSPSLPKTSFKDSHLNVIRCSGEEPSLKTDKTRNIRPDVFRCARRNDPSATFCRNQPSADTGELYLNVIESANNNNNARSLAGAPPSVSPRRLETPTIKKRPQENVITLRSKHARGSASSIRIYAMQDRNGGKTLDATDFDRVYGIDV